MEMIEWVISNLIIFEIVTNLIEVTIGAGMCFGALKWKKGLLTTTAIGWGFFLGGIMAIITSDFLGTTGVIVCIIFGIIALPILTYTVSGVNRFMLGFLVGCKVFFMLTTVLAKKYIMEVSTALILPLVAGVVIGIILMAWTKIRISAFVLGCSFIGASGIAPILSKWVNRIVFSITGDVSYLFDPIDLIFGIFKIELTDGWTLFFLLVFMITGAYIQIRNIKRANIPLDMPLIAYESTMRKNGRIYYKDGNYIDTL